jgi:hypothetical protein
MLLNTCTVELLFVIIQLVLLSFSFALFLKILFLTLSVSLSIYLSTSNTIHSHPNHSLSHNDLLCKTFANIYMYIYFSLFVTTICSHLLGICPSSFFKLKSLCLYLTLQHKVAIFSLGLSLNYIY